MTADAFTIDAQRTRLQGRFLDVFGFDSRRELLTAISDMEVGLDSLVQSVDSRTLVYSGWVYWFLFAKGYLQFAAAERVDDDNIYLTYLVRYYAPRDHDPGVAPELLDPEVARQRALGRFAFMQQAASATARGGVWDVDPVLVIVRDPPPQFPLVVYSVRSPAPLAAALVDGWHRLFAALLWEVPTLPGRLVRVDPPESPAPESALTTRPA
jgi:hypothetical protein